MFSECLRSESDLIKSNLRGLLVLMVVVFPCSFTLADEVEKSNPTLSVKPNKCISLHKGQLCYQKLKFSWDALPPGNYCLYQGGIQEALFCWNSADTRTYRYEFVGRESVVFQVRTEGAEYSFIEAKLSVASVYKKGKKSTSGWRLF